MIQGTGSSVGKSLVTAALCRVFTRKGLRVLPYKSQNMSNNAAATAEGGEIGRAQAIQAAACRAAPRVDMNPILLKPEADARSQVVLLGRPYKTLRASEYRHEKERLWAAATGALDRLRAEADLVIIEGAGSPAEINLRADEIVNMAVARYASSPVILVGDIDTGGVFAQFVGTLALLEEDERALVKGLVINKFRGDPSLLAPGITELERIGGKPVLGVVPWIRGLGLAEEDGAALEIKAGRARLSPGAPHGVDIAVIRLPRISNFDDFDALGLETGVSVRFVGMAAELGRPDAVILPGTKSTIDDLCWLKETGLELGVRWLSRLGTPVLGICGGFQMLGETIEDELGVEGAPRIERGLGLLPLRTAFTREKRVVRRRGRVATGLPGALSMAAGAAVQGYEIHAGISEVRCPGLFTLEDEGAGTADGVLDGAVSADGKTLGTYLHGLFDLPNFRRAWLSSIGWTIDGSATAGGTRLDDARDAALDRLADAVADAIDMDTLCRIVGIDTQPPPREGAR